MVQTKVGWNSILMAHMYIFFHLGSHLLSFTLTFKECKSSSSQISPSFRSKWCEMANIPRFWHKTISGHDEQTHIHFKSLWIQTNLTYSDVWISNQLWKASEFLSLGFHCECFAQLQCKLAQVGNNTKVGF